VPVRLTQVLQGQPIEPAYSVREAIRGAAGTGKAAWAMSNHDFGRLATRFGRENARAALMMLLTLPGPAFLYQGDEIAQGDGPPGEENRFDRAGRDRFRHPMQWDGSPGGGFSTGETWSTAVAPAERDERPPQPRFEVDLRLPEERRSTTGRV
jgi:glycosidase